MKITMVTMMMTNKIVLDSITWSYSSVNAYCTCPAMFKAQYIDCVPRENNAFAQYGSLCHSVQERYLKGKQELFSLYDTFNKEFPKSVTQQFPPSTVSLRDRYLESGQTYFSDFEGIPEGFDVVAVEEKVDTKIDGRPFVGFIDLILHNEDGYHIVDHKSKSGFKSEQERHDYLRQLYLYSTYVKEKFGEYPKTLTFNMFRVGKIVTVPFVKEDYDEALKWFSDTITAIYNDFAFDPVEDYYFCQNICSARNSCETLKNYV